MTGKFITIYSNLNLAPVELIKAILEENGINCLLKGYDTMRPYLSFGTGIELADVSSSDFAPASATNTPSTEARTTANVIPARLELDCVKVTLDPLSPEATEFLR